MSRASSARKSHQSARSQQSAKSQSRAPAKMKAPVATQAKMKAPAATPAPPAPPAAAQHQASKEEAVRALHVAAIKEIDADDTPRNSMRDKLQYEEGENSMSVQFNEDP